MARREPKDHNAEEMDRRLMQARRALLSQVGRNAAEFSVRIVQALMDAQILETTSNRDVARALETYLRAIARLEDFDIDYKIAPIREMSSRDKTAQLLITQYVIEDMLHHDKVEEIYGTNQEIFQVIDATLGKQPRKTDE